ncbi:MAG: hypothetical protein NC924_03280 [Candidatus Omnitrophica bacterium]|nr:hypothetical protein [Candidatus Omnitrophota bacterium]
MMLSPGEIIEYIKLLEFHLGEHAKYQILDPFDLNPSDIISIQVAAKKIANFIGLSDISFIVAIAKQRQYVGGHIDLSGDKDVFIELSEEVIEHAESVLSTLSHEIVHKYLQVHNIKIYDENKNERLTDIAAVYLGLGKLMLNGRECKKIKQENCIEEKKVTEKVITGYLDRVTLAFSYKIVCAMRNIFGCNLESGLCAESKEALLICRVNYYDYFHTCPVKVVK